MKPSSIKLIISEVVKTKGHEYINSSNKSFGDEGSPNTFENYFFVR